MLKTFKSLVGNLMKLKEITEGQGTFFIPKTKTQNYTPRRSDGVFFNPHQEINRDFSILSLRAYGKINSKSELRACEPLCGIGIRSARYVVEAPISSIYCNDINTNAVKIAKKNIKRLSNDKTNKIKFFNLDANFFLQTLSRKHVIFDFIDIDPFGTPIPFIQNSIQLITLHGLLAFTATDLATLAGIYPRALYAKYSVSHFGTRVGNIHEIASRVLITGIQHVGLTQGQSLIPIVTLYHRHFVRCFLIRNRGVDGVLDHTGFIYLCKNCQTRYYSHLGEKSFNCPNCGDFDVIKIGPLYLGSIQQPKYLSSMLQDEHLKKLGNEKRLRKLLHLMIEESSIEIPWTFDLPNLAKKCGVPVPPTVEIIRILQEMDYKCYRTHFSGTSLKTDANENELCSIISSFKP